MEKEIPKQGTRLEQLIVVCKHKFVLANCKHNRKHSEGQGCTSLGSVYSPSGSEGSIRKPWALVSHSAQTCRLEAL